MSKKRRCLKICNKILFSALVKLGWVFVCKWAKFVALLVLNPVVVAVVVLCGRQIKYNFFSVFLLLLW